MRVTMDLEAVDEKALVALLEKLLRMLLGRVHKVRCKGVTATSEKL